MKSQFEVRGWIKFGEVDNYKEGCDYKTGFHHHGTDYFKGNTIQEIIEECQNFVSSDNVNDLMLDSCDDIGRLDISLLENEEGYKASKREIELWKENKVTLYNVIYTFQIELVQRENVSLTKAFITK